MFSRCLYLLKRFLLFIRNFGFSWLHQPNNISNIVTAWKQLYTDFNRLFWYRTCLQFNVRFGVSCVIFPLQPTYLSVCYWKVKKEKFDAESDHPAWSCKILTSSRGHKGNIYSTPCHEYPDMIKVGIEKDYSIMYSHKTAHAVKLQTYCKVVPN
jgi:hypothetical protein